MLDELKARVCEANLSLWRSGLVVLTWGNVSARDPLTGSVVIKPSGVAYERMKPEDMVVLSPDGAVVEGALRPSSDAPTHVALYQAWPEVGGVVHTHSSHATMFAQARRPILCLGTTHADHFRGAVPVTRALTPVEVGGAYEQNTGALIVETFSHAQLSPLETPAVLCAGHGPFTWGASPEKAVENAVALEEVARMALGAYQLLAQDVALESYLQDKHFFRKHGAGAYYGQV